MHNRLRLPEARSRSNAIVGPTDERLVALLDSAPDAMVAAESQGHIVWVNTQTEKLFGYSREELLGASIDMLVPEHARDSHRDHRKRYLADPRDRPMGAGMDLAARRKNGREFPAEISLSTITTDEGLLVCAAIRDVTDRIEAKAERERLRAEAERERLEGQVQRAQRLESLGELAGGVAHDFNNLLAAIINFASFAGEEVSLAASAPGGERWVGVQRDIEQVTRAAKRASQLTHQLLAFARREVVQPRVLNLNAVVAETEELLRHTIGEHVDLATDLDPDLWPIVADPGGIEQVLVNLAVNARDAMVGGGMLRIDTGNVIADTEYASAHPDLAPGRYVRLRVGDSGTGMAAETQQHAFEPFFSTKPKGEGTGLGLATVYGIILQAGGRSTLYSEPGIGTTFSALLPATTAPVTTFPEVESPAAERGGGETILITEDEDAIREVARRILTRNGYPVLLAASGIDALELLDAFDGEIHLLLTDVVMPGLQGKELAEEARRRRPALRVLYMSGYAQPILASQGTLDPGVVLLEKPFTEQSLLGRVREVLDS